jgi:hypothetical protein
LAFIVSACSSTTSPAGGGGSGGGHLAGTGGSDNGGTNGGGNGGTGGASVGGTGGASAGVGGRVDAGGDARDGASGAGGKILLPGCLQELEAVCPIAASCAAPSVDAGGFVRVCTSGGNQCVRDAGPPVQQQVYKADGSLCYTLTTDSSGSCEYSSYTWTDATGHVVARGSFNAQTPPPFILNIACVTDAGSNDSVTCVAGDGAVTPGCLEPLGRLAHACACATP